MALEHPDSGESQNHEQDAAPLRAYPRGATTGAKLAGDELLVSSGSSRSISS